MSSSLTAPTSTTASSSNSPSRGVARGVRGDGVAPAASTVVPPGQQSLQIEVLARGALAGQVRGPELWDDCFGHYTRLVWLAQEPSPALEAGADRIAGMFGLPLTRVDVGVSRLEQALAALVEATL